MSQGLDPRVARKSLRGFKDAFLLQMRLDLIVHRQLLISTTNRRGKRGQFAKEISIVFAPAQPNNGTMSEHVYKKIELVGSSPKSFDDAVKKALERARKTVRNMRWFEVIETRGYLDAGKIAHWQVTLKVGFTLDD